MRDSLIFAESAGGACRRIEPLLLVAFAVRWLAFAVEPRDRSDGWLENLPVAIGVRRCRVAPTFACLHF